jgi:hypothetical protein
VAHAIYAKGTGSVAVIRAEGSGTGAAIQADGFGLGPALFVNGGLQAKISVYQTYSGSASEAAGNLYYITFNQCIVIVTGVLTGWVRFLLPAGDATNNGHIFILRNASASGNAGVRPPAGKLFYRGDGVLIQSVFGVGDADLATNPRGCGVMVMFYNGDYFQI